ncbi:glycosyltransferase [Williamwhitmania taraxaci]|uniref:Glycosyltransferase involved in cell wall bisynthesis n=1 Tax=Williamwhitmania taraxaci TaxID=1640674 RepID=A0A1G6GNS0_9BACT|nr:glycosyltransferase [Williamwhitmania taraxaci]SDB82836.1 Glycosyltransferase involved in cell wall bisynthesis [Williamwhitmania taraxaci]
MKILHIIMSLDYGGAENMLIKIINEDSDNEHRIVVLIDRCPLSPLLKRGNNVYPLFNKKSFNVIRASYRLIKVVKDYQPDILQSWMYHAEIIGLLVKLFRPSIKLFWNVRCSTKEWLSLNFRNRILFKILQLGSKLTSGIIVNSKHEVLFLGKSSYPLIKVIYIPNGFSIPDIIDKNLARSKLLEHFKLSGDVVLIGMVARFHPQKDHYNLIDAFKLLVVDFSNAHLILVGDLFDSEFKKFISEAGLASNVHFFGTTNKVFEVISGFDIGVLSSFTEAFPNVIGEYMLASLPVVATDVSDVREIMGSFGRVVSPRNSYALYKGLSEMVHLSLEESKKIGRLSRQRIIDIYPIDKIARDYILTYKASLS